MREALEFIRALTSLLHKWKKVREDDGKISLFEAASFLSLIPAIGAAVDNAEKIFAEWRGATEAEIKELATLLAEDLKEVYDDEYHKALIDEALVWLSQTVVLAKVIRPPRPELA